MSTSRIRPATPEHEARAILASDSPPSLAAFAGLALGLPGARQPFARTAAAGPRLTAAPILAFAASTPPPPGGPAAAPRPPAASAPPRGPRLNGAWWIFALLVVAPAIWIAALWAILR